MDSKDIGIDSGADTRERLLVAALLVFSQKGFDGVGIREIALRAKANSALVQYYFGGKEGLYVEALRYAFQQGGSWIETLPQPPIPGSPGARELARKALESHIRTFLNEMVLCHCKSSAFTPEVFRAASILWNREMLSPRPAIADFLLESVKPFVEHMQGCIKVLRPDLNEEDLFRMGMSIHGQLHHMHDHLELIRLLRGRGYGPEDLGSLAEHFIRFSLKGLGMTSNDLSDYSTGVES